MRKTNNLIQPSPSIIQQLKAFRNNPQYIRKNLEQRKSFINHNGLLFSPSHPNKSIKTKQGTFVINELIGQLFNQRHLQNIKQNVFLSECANLIALRYKQQNIEEQIFIKKIVSQIRMKINQSAQYLFISPIKCLIGIGFRQHNQPLLTMLIDDGDPSRTKRKILFSNDYKYCGASSIQMSDSTLICGVYLLASDVKKK